MSTTQPEADKIFTQVQQVAEARIRPMMGEYILYVDEKVIGQINDGLLYIKITPFGESFAPNLKQRAPYPGAKPAFVVSLENMSNSDWLRDFVAGTVAQLPDPKKK